MLEILEMTLELVTVLEQREFRTVQSREILSLVEKFEGVKRTRAIAEEFARKATTLLGEFPESVYRDAVASIPQFILNRSS